MRKILGQIGAVVASSTLLPEGQTATKTTVAQVQTPVRKMYGIFAWVLAKRRTLEAAWFAFGLHLTLSSPSLKTTLQVLTVVGSTVFCACSTARTACLCATLRPDREEGSSCSQSPMWSSTISLCVTIGQAKLAVVWRPSDVAFFMRAAFY